MNFERIAFGKQLGFSASLVLLIGCTSLERSSTSGYGAGSAPPQSAARPRPQKTLENQKIYLSQLENSIPTKEELAQYSKLLPYLQSDTEKIEYLTLPSFAEKQKWVREHHLGERANDDQSVYENAVETKDIAIGMPMALVRQSWGEPESPIEVSGKPEFKNEKWTYHKSVSTSDGYRMEKRTVYFEGGRVAGWEVH